MTDIEFNFPVLADLMRQAEDDLFPDSVVPAASPNLGRELRVQINSAFERQYTGPTRIRLTEMVPRGMMLLAPFELDENGNPAEPSPVPAPHRKLGDGGPEEVIVHPDDWDEIAKPYAWGHANFRNSARYMDAWGHANFRNGARYMGIPVIDDTIEARRRRAA